MSKGFAIALVAALVIVPWTARVGAAEEQAGETKQECCEKGGDCSCTDCKCAEGDSENCSCTDCKCAGGECTEGKCADGKCAGGKCVDGNCPKGKCNGGKCDGSKTVAAEGCKGKACANGECQVTNCSAEGCKEAGCKCAGSEFAASGSCPCGKSENCESCATCEETDCRGTAVAFVAFSEGECKSGKCCKGGCCIKEDSLAANAGCSNGCSDCSGPQISGHCVRGCEPSVLGWNEQSPFGAPTNFHTATLSDVVWQQIANELAQSSPDEVNAIYASPAAMTVKQFMQTSAVVEDKPVTQIQYTIQIVEDPSGCLSEYESLRRGAPMMTAESKTLLPAMRMLKKHELIEQVSSPRIICSAGEKAELEIDGESSKGADLRMAIAGREFENGLVVELNMQSGESRGIEMCTQILIEPGQSIVQKVNPAASSDDEGGEVRTARYIVVTPEIVK